MNKKIDIEDTFSYHAPTPDSIVKYALIRNKAKELAELIIDNTLPCADQSASIRKLRECVMTANASIALDGKI